jgi:hypothetical protein
VFLHQLVSLEARFMTSIRMALMRSGISAWSLTSFPMNIAERSISLLCHLLRLTP